MTSIFNCHFTSSDATTVSSGEQMDVGASSSVSGESISKENTSSSRQTAATNTSNNASSLPQHSPISHATGPALKKSRLSESPPAASGSTDYCSELTSNVVGSSSSVTNNLTPRTHHHERETLSAATSAIGLSIFPQDNLPSMPEPPQRRGGWHNIFW